MKKHEANFQTIFNSWLRKVYKKTGAYELKIAHKDTLYFKQLEEHQETWLLSVSNGVAVYKITDDSIGYKPFDCFCLAGQRAYVVVLYPTSKTFYLIPINNFVFYRDHKSKKKSLSEDDAKEIAVKVVKL
jgi:penicillin-binding protein-related factor A (putative recombinase)